MSNGLLNGISEGLRLGLQGFTAERDRRDKRAIQEQELETKRMLLARQLQEDEEKRQSNVLGLLSKGYKLKPGEGLEEALVGDTKLYYNPKEFLTPAQEEQNKLERAKILAGMRGTPGQQAVDKAFSDQFVDYTMGGGEARAETNIDKLKQAAGDITEKKATGGLLQKIPVVGEVATKIFQPGKAAIKQEVDSVAIQGMKETFGGNPTEGERKALLENLYDPKLDPEIISKRVANFAAALAQQKQVKDAAADYFRRNNYSMKGYKGPKPMSKSEFLKQFANKEETPKESLAGPGGLIGNQPKTVRVSNGKEVLEIPASDLQSAIKDGFKQVK